MSNPTPKPNATPASGGVHLTPKAILAIVIAVAALVFVFSNTSEASLNFLWFSIVAPAWLMLLVLFVAGGLVGFFLGRNRYKRR